MQSLLNKKGTFKEADDILIELRTDVLNQITLILDGYPEDAFNQMP